MCEFVCIFTTFTVFYCTFLLILTVCMSVCMSLCVCVWAMLPDSNKMMMIAAQNALRRPRWTKLCTDSSKQLLQFHLDLWPWFFNLWRAMITTHSCAKKSKSKVTRFEKERGKQTDKPTDRTNTTDRNIFLADAFSKIKQDFYEQWHFCYQGFSTDMLADTRIQSKLNAIIYKRVFSLISQLSTRHAAERRRLLSIDISCPRSAQQQTRCCCQSMGQTDGRMVDRFVDPVPHTTYASSVNKLTH